MDTSVIQRQMQYLQNAIVSSLRKGDVATKYSSTQMLVLLMDANVENAGMVAERILCMYRRKAGNNTPDTLYDIRQLTAGGQA